MGCKCRVEKKKKNEREKTTAREIREKREIIRNQEKTVYTLDKNIKLFYTSCIMVQKCNTSTYNIRYQYSESLTVTF